MKLTAKSMLLVFAGGALGSLLRFLIGEVLDSLMALALVNLLGAAFLGWINGSAAAANPRFTGASVALFWGAGFAGGFTTMSGLAMAFVLLAGSTQGVLAISYLLAQFVFGIFAYLGGYRAGSGAFPGE
jgi:fluoride exporter